MNECTSFTNVRTLSSVDICGLSHKMIPKLYHCSLVRPQNIFEVNQQQNLEPLPQHHGSPKVSTIKQCTQREWVNFMGRKWVLSAGYERFNFWHLNLYSNKRKAWGVHDSSISIYSILKDITTPPSRSHHNRTSASILDATLKSGHHFMSCLPVSPNPLSVHRRVWSWMIPSDYEVTQPSLWLPERPQRPIFKWVLLELQVTL